ncbi:MAG: helix-hairpin-helix domain-containing protein [Porticoccaceae bacterium]|nr:helix-hairpin-helix domain-containing protein [Porticoccaceae bacterium]
MLKKRLNKSKKILWIGAALIALGGSSIVTAAPADKGRALVSDQAQQQVNINTASASELASSLKGVGLKTAQAIVAYRDANGDFQSLDGLMMVKGVGSKTIKKNMQRITLE